MSCLAYLDFIHVGEDLISVLGRHGDVTEIILQIARGVGLLDEVSRNLELTGLSISEDTGVKDWVESRVETTGRDLLVVLGAGVTLIVLILAVPNLNTAVGSWDGHFLVWGSRKAWGDAEASQSWA